MERDKIKIKELEAELVRLEANYLALAEELDRQIDFSNTLLKLYSKFMTRLGSIEVRCFRTYR